MAFLVTKKTADWLRAQQRKTNDVLSRAVRTPFVGDSFRGWRQWHCTVVDQKLRVRSGSLAWGGGHYAVWPSGRTVSRGNYVDLELSLSVGKRQFVVWYTKCHACPLVNCPKSPNGNTTCPAVAGDPSEFKADSGDIKLMDSVTRETGWTDYHVIATIEHTSEDAYVINQILTSEIAVQSIVYPGETGEESDDEDTPDEEPDCASGGADSELFPSSVDGQSPPGGNDSGTIIDFENDEEKFPSKTGPCW